MFEHKFYIFMTILMCCLIAAFFATYRIRNYFFSDYLSRKNNTAQAKYFRVPAGQRERR